MSDKDFERIPFNGKEKLPRTDWYFEDHRIRKFTEDSGKEKFFRVEKGYEGLSVKKHVYLHKLDIYEHLEDHQCTFKVTCTPKFIPVGGDSLYVEKLDVYVDGKLKITFYSTEAENPYAEKFIEDTKSAIIGFGIIEDIIPLGNMSMREIVNNKLNGKGDSGWVK